MRLILCILLFAVLPNMVMGQAAPFGNKGPFTEDPFSAVDEVATTKKKDANEDGFKDGPPPPPVPLDDHLWIVVLAGIGIGIYFYKKEFFTDLSRQLPRN
ncbi:MAG: hypothetical protein ACPF8V_02860 [Luteibaculum sp.]